MTDKELKKLNRVELLELLLEQTRENEKLLERIAQLEAELADKQLKVQKAGSLAQAALQLNGVFEAADAAARQYLENAVRMEAEIRRRYEAVMEDKND